MYKIVKKYNKTKAKPEYVGLYICDSCNKPISETIDTVVCVDSKSEKKLYYFHQSAVDCANAEPEKKEFRRHAIDSIKVPKARRQ